MNEKLTHHFGFLRHLALGGAAIVAFGCGADAIVDEQPAGAQFMEDTGTAEEDEALERQAQSLESDPAGDGGADKGIVSTVCGVANSVMGVSDADATEFELGQTDGTLESGEKTSLFNAFNKSFVQYGKRSLGINLTWSSTDPAGNIELHKPTPGVINYGEKVAIRVNNGGYLKYGKRSVGINLNWVSSNTTDKPYEWEVRGGTPGTPVATNTPVRLFNTVVNDNLVYCRRPTGINLGWAKDCTTVPRLGRLRTGYCPT